jgi:hypothetical protein
VEIVLAANTENTDNTDFLSPSSLEVTRPVDFISTVGAVMREEGALRAARSEEGG